MTLDQVRLLAQLVGYTIERKETDTEIVEHVIRPDGSVAITAKKCKAVREEIEKS